MGCLNGGVLLKYTHLYKAVFCCSFHAFHGNQPLKIRSPDKAALKLLLTCSPWQKRNKSKFWSISALMYEINIHYWNFNDEAFFNARKWPDLCAFCQEPKLQKQTTMMNSSALKWPPEVNSPCWLPRKTRLLNRVRALQHLTVCQGPEK